MKLGTAALALAAVATLWLANQPDSSADTIVLKNGSTIHGKATRNDGSVIVDFGAAGQLKILESRVAKIIENNLNDFDKAEAKPAPAADKKPWVVNIKPDRRRYGRGRYIGMTSDSSDGRVLVLEIAGGGEIRILRDDIHSMGEAKDTDTPQSGPRPAVEATSFKTTHQVTLKNGREIRGNLIATPDSQPLMLRIGSYGLMEIRRGKIDKVEEKEGRVDIPKSSPEPAISEEVDSTPPADDRANLKSELRNEIIRDLLDRLIDQRLDGAVGSVAEELKLSTIAKAVPAETAKQIQVHVSELGRQRTRNRVRAETALRTHGHLALPFLTTAVSHPLDLTRRAALRLIRDAGDLRGTPLAIDALSDSDFFVRKHAHEAISKIIGKTNISFDASDSASARRRAQRQFRGLWKEIVRFEIEAAAKI